MDYVVLLRLHNPNGHPTNLCTQHLILTTTQTYRSNTMNFSERQRLIAEKGYRNYNSPNKNLLEQIEGLDEFFTSDGVSYIEYIDFFLRCLVDENIEKATKDKAISIMNHLRGKMETETNDINAAREAGLPFEPEEIMERRMLAYSTNTFKKEESLEERTKRLSVLSFKADKKAREQEEAREIGHVYFYESAGNFKIGKSCCEQIHKRVRHQRPDKVIAISEASNNYHKLEKDLHREYASKRMGRYEIFCGLTKVEIKKITEKLKSNWRLVEGINRDLNFQKSLALSTV